MEITLDDLILKYVDQIIHVIDLLPLSKDIKTVLKYTVATDFHDAWQFDFICTNELKEEKAYNSYYLEDPDNPDLLLYKRTRGINCEDRADEYIYDLIREINCVNQDEIENYFFGNTDLFLKVITVYKSGREFYVYERIYTIIDAPLYFDKVSWRQLPLFDFLKRYNLQYIQDSDIDHYVQKILGYDFPAFHNEIAFNQHLPRPFDYLGELLKKEKQNEYAVEEFENVFCFEAAAMCHEFSGGLNPDQDAHNINAYFEKFIYSIKHETLIEKRVDGFESESEKIEFIEISNYQFHLYLPENRRKPIIEKFLRFYYFPGKPPKVISGKIFNFISVLIDKYGEHFDVLKDHFENWTSDSSNVNISFKSLRLSQASLLKVKNDPAFMQQRLNQKAIKETNYFEFCDYYIGCMNGTDTLDQWESYKDYDIVHFAQQFPFSADLIAGVKSRRLGHYNKHVENIFNDVYKKRIGQYSVKSDKLMIANGDADFINMIIIGEIDELKCTLFNSNIPFENWGKIALQLNSIIRHNISESDDNYNIHHPDCYAQAQAIFMYKEHLACFLSKPNPITKIEKRTPKGGMRPLKPIPLAFTLIKNDEQYLFIADHRKSLIKAGLIPESTKLVDMRLMFHNAIPSTPTKWLGNISQLAYYVKCMHNDKKVIKNIRNTIWKVTAELYVDKDGNKYNWEDFRGLKDPANASLINKAVEILEIPEPKSTT